MTVESRKILTVTPVSATASKFSMTTFATTNTTVFTGVFANVTTVDCPPEFSPMVENDPLTYVTAAPFVPLVPFVPFVPLVPFVPFVPSLPSSTSLVTAAHSPLVIVSVAVVLLAVANETQQGLPFTVGMYCVHGESDPLSTPVEKVNVSVELGTAGELTLR